ncbi:biotin--[bacterium]|nr:biotin--[acetyl-CoA-carboxylase] ligase [bacterium]
MKVIKLEEIDSTNSYAKLNINTLEDKTVIHAIRQNSGRGRFDRKWIDLGEGNLFFSIVIKPSDEYINSLSNITQYACVILCEILEKYGVNPKIKWPNDVMIDGKRKISGILSETVIEGGSLKGLVVGIGINLNADIEDVNNIKDRVATSLNIEIGKTVNVDYFLDEFLNEFFKNY